MVARVRDPIPGVPLVGCTDKTNKHVAHGELFIKGHLLTWSASRRARPLGVCYWRSHKIEKHFSHRVRQCFISSRGRPSEAAKPPAKAQELLHFKQSRILLTLSMLGDGFSHSTAVLVHVLSALAKAAAS